MKLSDLLSGPILSLLHPYHRRPHHSTPNLFSFKTEQRFVPQIQPALASIGAHR
jgi:hypothetical protein